MHIEAFHSLVDAGEDRSPDRLHDRSLLLHQRLDLLHDEPALGHIDGGVGLIEQLIELGFA